MQRTPTTRVRRRLSSLLLAAVAAGAPWARAEPAADGPNRQGSIGEIQIAPVEQLREDPEATRALLETLTALGAKIRAARADHLVASEEVEWPYGLTDRDVKPLSDVARNHPKSRAALLAKFTIGRLRGNHEASRIVDNHRRFLTCFKEIATKYKGTHEALIARLCLESDHASWMTLKRGPAVNLADVYDPEEHRRRQRECIAAFMAAKPELRRLDEDTTPLARALRLLLTGQADLPTWGTWARNAIAHCEDLAGNREDAMRIWRDVLRDFKGTQWAEIAKSRLSLEGRGVPGD